MRPKIVIIVVTLGLFVFGTFFAIRHAPDRSSRNAQPEPKSLGAPEPGDSLAAAEAQSEPAVAPPTNSVRSTIQTTNSSEDAHQAYVEQRTAELMDMAMTDERANLDSILSELSNRDPEIRKAALEAAIQFGSRDAIPKLADAVSQTDDPNEKTALTDAIEFLKLPSLTEIHAQSKPVANNATTGNKPARRANFARRVVPTPPSNQ